MLMVPKDKVVDPEALYEEGPKKRRINFKFLQAKVCQQWSAERSPDYIFYACQHNLL